MHIRTINKVTTVGLFTLSALTLCSVLAALYFQSEQVGSLEQQRESLKLANQLAQGSDLLTNAVRSYAATGEAKYEEVYNHEVNIDRSRDKAVQGLVALGTPSNELGLIEAAKRNSDDLINLENRAFDAGRAGNLKLAVELVYGRSYHTAKARIMEPIGQFRQIMNQRLAEKVDQASRKADASMAAAISMVIATILATSMAQLMFYRRKVVSPLLQMQAEVDGLVTRKEKAVLSTLDDDSEIGSLARSIAAYYKIALQLEDQQQTKQQLSEIVVTLQRAVDLPDLAQKLMSHISPILDVGYGLFYVADAEKRTLRMVGGYGLAPGDSDREVAFGDGLAGQCAIDQKLILVTNPPADYIRIASGTGTATPACIMLWPLIQNNKIVGVVELASFQPFDAGDEAFLAELEPILAANVLMFGHRQDIEKEYARQRVSEDRMNAIVNNVSDGIFGLDMDGTTIFVNPAACRMLGYTQDELVGQPMHAQVHHTYPDGTPHPREKCPMYLTSNDGKPRYVAEDVMWHKNGSAIEIEYNTMPMSRKDGEHIGSVIAFRDISEHKRAELAMRQSERRLHTLYDSTSDAVMLLDEKGFFDCNKATLAIFRCSSKEEFCSKNPADLSPQAQPCGTDSMTLAGQHISTAMEQGFEQFEWEHKRIDTGEVFLAEVRLNRMELDGRLVLQASVRDITERKHAELVIAEERERLQNILDTSPVCVAITTQEVFRFANPMFVEMFGVKPGDKAIDIYAHAEDREKVVEMLERDGKVVNHQIQMVDCNTQIRDMLVSFLPISYAGENGVLGWLIDVSDIKSARRRAKN